MRQKDIITRCKPPVFVQSFVIIPQHLLRWPASSYSDAEAYPEHDQDTVSLQSPWSPDYPSANVSPQSSQSPSVPWPVAPLGDPVTAASSIPVQQWKRRFPATVMGVPRTGGHFLLFRGVVGGLRNSSSRAGLIVLVAGVSRVIQATEGLAHFVVV
jgi:hypothetical protein